MEFEILSRVELFGLKTQKYNGQIGTFMGFENERCKIKIDDQLLLFKKENLKLVKEKDLIDKQKNRIDVFYGRTEGETGYKEYAAVIVRTNEQDLDYGYDMYEEPRNSYQILKEV